MSKKAGFINTTQNYNFGNYRKKTKKAAKNLVAFLYG